MGSLLSGFQRIIGPKTFAHKVTFKGEVRFEKPIERTMAATMKMAYAPGIDLGTLKLLPFGGTQRNILGAAGSEAWTLVTGAAAYIPKGTQALWVHGFARSGAAAAGQVTLAYAFDKVNTGTASWDRCPYMELNYNAAGATAIYADAQTHLIIPVDASGYFYYYRTTATNTDTPWCYLVLLGYYL